MRPLDYWFTALVAARIGKCTACPHHDVPEHHADLTRLTFSCPACAELASTASAPVTLIHGVSLAELGLSIDEAQCDLCSSPDQPRPASWVMSPTALTVSGTLCQFCAERVAASDPR